VTHKWADEVVRFLDELAYKVGWIEVTEHVAERIAAQMGAAGQAAGS